MPFNLLFAHTTHSICNMMRSIRYNLIRPALKTCEPVPLLPSAAAMVTLTPLR